MGKKRRAAEAPQQFDADVCDDLYATLPPPGQRWHPGWWNPVRIERALQLETVAACIDLITDVCGQLDLVARSGPERDPDDEPAPYWIARPDAYGPDADARLLVTTCVWDMATDGAAYLMAHPVGKASWRLVPISPERVSVSFTPMFQREWQVDGSVVQVVNGPARRGGLLVVAKNRAHRIPRPHGPLTYAAIEDWLTVEAYAAQVYAISHSGQTLNTDKDITPAVAKRYQDMMERAHGNPWRRRMPVFGSGLHLVDNTMSARDAQWLEVREFNARAQARLFRVPPHMLGLPITGTSMTYTNGADNWKHLLRTALSGYLRPLEAALTGLTPIDASGGHPQRIVFDRIAWLESLDEGDIAAPPPQAPAPPPPPPRAGEGRAPSAAGAAA